MKIETQISYRYLKLIEIFFKANDLDVTIQDMRAYPYDKIILEYENDSATAHAITMLSIKHCGLVNMLEDYLIKCGIPPELIDKGKFSPERDMEEVDKQWLEHRKAIGLR